MRQHESLSVRFARRPWPKAHPWKGPSTKTVAPRRCYGPQGPSRHAEAIPMPSVPASKAMPSSLSPSPAWVKALPHDFRKYWQRLMAFGDKREFHTMKCLGYGAFGVTLQVQYIPPGMPRHAIKVPEYYAVKVELVEHEDANQLQFEARLYSMLADAKIKHFPKIYHVSSTPQMRVMVMDLMGPNLESCLEACNGRFSEKTIYMIACEGLRRLRDLHDFGFLHRDIKPENFLVPYGKRPGPITLVDMGMCKRYFDPATKQHVPMQRGDSFQGTLRFASIQQHLFLRQSRRDDLQSFAYMLIYFWYGTLPWQGLQPRVDAHIRANARHETPPARDEIDILLERPQDKADAIRQIKYKMRDDLLCGKAPRVLKDFLVYTKQGLGYETRPDYDACITMFEEAARRAGIALDGRYDWCG